MFPNAMTNRKTSIIDDAVGLEQNLAQQARSKGKGKTKQQTTGSVLKPKSSPELKATSNLGTRFYEEDGLKIPLYEPKGKKRAHARASAGLRNKPEEELLNIVEAYAGTEKRRAFKDGKKKEIADWIEEKETLALGPNPKSKLNCKVDQSDYLEEELTDVVTSPKAKAATHSNDAIHITKPTAVDPATKFLKDTAQISPKSHGTFDAQSNRKPPAKIAQPGGRKRSAPNEDLHGQSHPKHHKRDPQANSQSIEIVISKTGSPVEEKAIDKRTLDSASILTEPQQTTRKLEPHETPEATEHTEDTTKHARSSGKEQGRSRRVHFQEHMVASSDHTKPAQGGTRQRTERVSPNELLHAFMNEAGLDVAQSETSTRIVPLPEQGGYRVLTVSFNPRKTQIALHDTGIFDRHSSSNGAQLAASSSPYLKPGKHGFGGDFDNDPERATGKGHDYNPEDMTRYEKHLEFRSSFNKKHKTYPKLQEGEKVAPEVKAAWDNEQKWYRQFSKKYPGRRLDQWPCGCQKLSDEIEGESEEE